MTRANFTGNWKRGSEARSTSASTHRPRPGRRQALKKLSARYGDGKGAGRGADPAKLTHAPGNGAPIGGLKVVAENGWFAARPSGTEDIYKIYAESFKGREHLKKVQDSAREIVDAAYKAAGA